MKKSILNVLFVLFAIVLFAQPKITGQKVMENVYNRPYPKDLNGVLTMTLINKRGQKRVRKIRQFIKDNGKVKKKIMFFISPADVKNTSFMNWSYDDDTKDDNQWIYLPALKKIKRLSNEDKSDYFMGSDFTYDDLGDRKPNEDTHKILREEKYNGEDCYVVESIPKEEDYMYSKTITWVIKDKWIGIKKEFYDEDGEHLKTLEIKDYKKIKNYWMIVHSEMNNVQKQHKTIMKFDDLKVDTGIPDSKFSERMMRRGIK